MARATTETMAKERVLNSCNSPMVRRVPNTAQYSTRCFVFSARFVFYFWRNNNDERTKNGGGERKSEGREKENGARTRRRRRRGGNSVNSLRSAFNKVRGGPLGVNYSMICTKRPKRQIGKMTTGRKEGRKEGGGGVAAAAARAGEGGGHTWCWRLTKYK